MNREALIQLRRVVEEAPDDRFDMSWFDNNGCSHCAAGWAYQDEWFQKNLPLPYPSRRGGWSALIARFGLTEEQGNDLFALNVDMAVGRRVTKEQVLDNIDRLLAGDATQRY